VILTHLVIIIHAPNVNIDLHLIIKDYVIMMVIFVPLVNIFKKQLGDVLQYQFLIVMFIFLTNVSFAILVIFFMKVDAIQSDIVQFIVSIMDA
jgi:hypothetical protein